MITLIKGLLGSKDYQAYLTWAEKNDLPKVLNPDFVKQFNQHRMMTKGYWRTQIANHDGVAVRTWYNFVFDIKLTVRNPIDEDASWEYLKKWLMQSEIL